MLFFFQAVATSTSFYYFDVIFPRYTHRLVTETEKPVHLIANRNSENLAVNNVSEDFFLGVELFPPHQYFNK